MLEKIKGYAYCKECGSELLWNEEKQEFEYQCNCNDNKKFKYMLLWCEDCQKFTSRRGLKKDSKCCKCAIRL